MANVNRPVTYNNGSPQLSTSVINLNQNDTVTFTLTGFPSNQNGVITNISFFTVDNPDSNPSKGDPVGQWNRSSSTSGTVTSEDGYDLNNYYSFATTADSTVVVTDVQAPASNDPHWYTLTITWGSDSEKTFDPEMINKKTP